MKRVAKTLFALAAAAFMGMAFVAGAADEAPSSALAFKVKEYDPTGKVISETKTDLDSLGGRKAENWPFTAIRLASGNTHHFDVQWGGGLFHDSSRSCLTTIYQLILYFTI